MCRAGFLWKAVEGPQGPCTPHQRSGSKFSCAHSEALSQNGQWPDLLIQSEPCCLLDTGHVGVGWLELTLTSQTEPVREGAQSFWGILDA